MKKEEAICLFILLILTIILIFWNMAAEEASEWKGLAIIRSGSEGYLVEAVVTTQEGDTWVTETSSTQAGKSKKSFIVAEGVTMDKSDFIKSLTILDIEELTNRENIYDLNNPADVDELIQGAMQLDELIEFMNQSLEKLESDRVNDPGEVLQPPF